VNPYLFIALTTICAPPFYYSIYRLTKALATKQRRQMSLWSSVFLGASALPYLYVLVCGSNMPWWIYLILGALLAQGTVSLVRKLVPAGRTSAGTWRSVRRVGIRTASPHARRSINDPATPATAPFALRGRKVALCRTQVDG